MFRFLALLFSTLFLFAIVGVAGVLGVFWQYGRDLPDYHQLAHYAPPVTTRVYAGDGRLVAEYAVEKRSFVPIGAMPQQVINAFLAAEDKNFYQHSGIDPVGIARAVVTNLKNRGMGSDRRPVGASTITQQVARNFLLNNEVSLSRKIKEAILAFRIEQAFSKQHILELYLNEIYLGQGSYGVAAAALNYFDKGLDELSVSEVAFLASLPKAPSRNPQAFRERRDYVIGRMLEDGYISSADARTALAEPISTRPRAEAVLVPGGDYFAEDIRRELAGEYGEDSLYKGGLSVRSTLDPALQEIATRVLRNGLIAYDRRHGWRGPLTHIDASAGWNRRLAALPPRPEIAPWPMAMVLGANDPGAVEIGFADGRKGRIPMAELRWARPVTSQQGMGAVPRRPSDVLQAGDVIAVEAMSKSEDGKEHYGPDTYTLRQLPKVEGALVAIDPHTGRVLAMQGGFSFARSQFNRATQALRQPGSAFKPFVYMAALDSGYTPSSLVLDGPIELEQGAGMPKWRPKNDHNDYLGPTTLRVGVEKSRNLMTVRLAATIGISKVAAYAEKFGVVDKLPHELAMALGAGETTPLRLTAAYAQIVNGGKRVTPTLIDRIQDRNGATIYRHDTRTCDGCQSTFYTEQDMPEVPDNSEQLVDPMTAYQMVHILEGVVARGTGRIVASVGKPLAGKTGTSNDSKDTWFIGFSPDLAVGVFVGFDEPISLGQHEFGATIPAPIFRDFMTEALKDKPPTPFRVPPGIRLVRVNAATGRPAQPGDANIIYEAFKPDSVPAGGTDEQVLDNDAGVMGLGYSAMPGLGTAEDQPSASDGGAPAMSDELGGAAAPTSGGAAALPGQPTGVPTSGLSPSAPRAPAEPAVPQAGGLY
ncbi:PBP1A family penicillin-binding protein [Telmatospirillum sp.]|uniref:PBP1A family penicillin-binding protein n=1 Tax=Telmatospirillum sp. TaxID=2079197 RepID=UPI0028438DE9|nr:PBP1A family penicillin-binding protein [Telmatospirillum sp.]MDR3439024.1 PBP1A family penicillin-binding protein [Telmatospirillum sp.]